MEPGVSGQQGPRSPGGTHLLSLSPSLVIVDAPGETGPVFDVNTIFFSNALLDNSGSPAVQLLRRPSAGERS
ncbi:unnamed protein product [Boreogadus saida]